jgi:hypothetical protein
MDMGKHLLYHKQSHKKNNLLDFNQHAHFPRIRIFDKHGSLHLSQHNSILNQLLKKGNIMY